MRNNQQVLHLSIHSFHCTAENETTALDLIYDCNRHGEREVVRIWRSLLANQHPTYRVRINHPITHTQHNFLHKLRKQYNESEYLGIVVEINQCLMNKLNVAQQLTEVISNTLEELLQLL